MGLVTGREAKTLDDEFKTEAHQWADEIRAAQVGAFSTQQLKPVSALEEPAAFLRKVAANLDLSTHVYEPQNDNPFLVFDNKKVTASKGEIDGQTYLLGFVTQNKNREAPRIVA